MSVINPPIDDLLAKVDSKYTLCIVAAKRARQINDMTHGLRDQALLSMHTSDLTDLMKKKPLSKALEEIATGDVSYERTKDSYK
ncbi:MAG: DNA-directed RNA polymerase subunit omega [Coriobacteriia bacterium]|nr:DNA-directed RNA polymerase subunit omega [Coriobacteriia bacterium]